MSVALNELRLTRDPSLGVQLLGDVRRVFEEHEDRLPTVDLLTRLNALEDAPGWGTDGATSDQAVAAVEGGAALVAEQIDDAVVERAQALIEEEARIAPTERERVPGMVNPVAEFMKLSADPHYADAFRSYLRDPIGGPKHVEHHGA